IGQPNSLYLLLCFEQNARLFGAIESQHRSNKARATASVCTQRNVFKYGHVGPNTNMLEAATDAQRRDAARVQPANGFVFKENLAVGGGQYAGEQIEQGTFSRSVGAYHTQ